MPSIPATQHASDTNSDLPLFGAVGVKRSRVERIEYDEDGSLALARALARLNSQRAATQSDADLPKTTFDPQDLDGSWYLQLVPRGPHVHVEVRGPMRIEVAPPRLRISGDIYARTPVANGAPVEILRPITERPLLFGNNWYPHLPPDDYSWYFRSVGVTFEAGALVFKFERHLWNRTTQEFIGQENSGKDNGFMEFDCAAAELLSHAALPQPTLQIKGHAQIGGQDYDAVLTKTSPYYRGCAVEVDAMTNRSFPLAASTALGASISFTSIYRNAGMDCMVSVDESNLPEDDELSPIELQTALAAHRKPANITDEWRLWLLVGSSQGSLYGLMFDDVVPYREGTCGFFDPRLPTDANVAVAARGQRLGDVPEAFLRTLVHEAGHAFNLFHPKHDVHSVPIGTTIMNQTGDVMGFATEADPYPGNVTFAFDEHNRSSLIHSPDPQVAPGWKRFGWGHGSLSQGIAEPVDALGLLQHCKRARDLVLDLELPEVIFRGQFVTARFTVTNIGKQPRMITSALNLSEGDLRLLVKPPNEELHDVRDVIVACGDRALTTLEPGETLRGVAQVFYTNIGFTFRQTGRYLVSAELDPGDGSGTMVRSEVRAVIVRAPVAAQEEEIARLSMTPGVGRAFAFGDHGMDESALRNLEALASQHADSDNGVAANLTLANAHGRNLRDLKTGRVARQVDMARAARHFDQVASDREDDPAALALAAAAIAAPTEASAPVLDMAQSWLANRGKPGASAAKAADIMLESGPEKGGRRPAPSDVLQTTAPRRLPVTTERSAQAAERGNGQADDAQALLKAWRRSIAGGEQRERRP